MATTLYIRLGSTPEQQVCWLARGDAATPSSRTETLQRLAEQGEAARLVVFAPAKALVTLAAEVPPLSGQRLRQALPYALEEQLAEDVEQFHFAHGQRDSEGSIPVIALAREQMEQWHTLFDSLDFHPHQLLNEALTLPWQEGEWSLLLEERTALLRTGRHRAHSVPLAQLPALLSLAWKQRKEETTPTLRVYDARATVDGLEPEIAAAVAGAVEYEKITDQLRLLAQGAEADAGINLLQGEFSRKEQLGKLWRPWRLTAMLLGGWLLLQVLMSIGQYFSLRSLDNELYASIEQVYRDTFPQAKNVVNPRLQMERKLAELRGGTGSNTFAALLAGTGPVLSGMKGVTLQSLRYKQGELELELNVAGLPLLDQIKSGLQSKRLSVEVRSATARGDRVESRIIVREGGA